MKLSKYISDMETRFLEFISHTNISEWRSSIRIRKFIFWETNPTYAIFISLLILFFVLWFVGAYSSINNSIKIGLARGYLWLWIIVWIFLLIREIKLIKVKNYKRNWKWEKHQLIIQSIKQYKQNSGKWLPFYWCYVIATDGDKIYYSDAYDFTFTEWKETENTPEYRKINWHKIVIGDTIDVYFHPNNHQYYRVDVESLFDK